MALVLMRDVVRRGLGFEARSHCTGLLQRRSNQCSYEYAEFGAFDFNTNESFFYAFGSAEFTTFVVAVDAAFLSAFV